MKFDKFVFGLGAIFILALLLLHYFPLAQKIHRDPCIAQDEVFHFNIVNINGTGNLNQFGAFEKTEAKKYSTHQYELNLCEDKGGIDTAKLYLW